MWRRGVACRVLIAAGTAATTEDKGRDRAAYLQLNLWAIESIAPA